MMPTAHDTSIYINVDRKAYSVSNWFTTNNLLLKFKNK